MSVPLDSRVVRILRWLLEQTRPRSTADLASDLGLSQRVVRYRLGAVESYLRDAGLHLVRQRGSGLWIEGPAETIANLRSLLAAEAPTTPRVYARDEREHVLLASLLWSAPDPTSLDALQDQLEVSKASARRDLKRTEPWLERRGLFLARQPGVGITVVGSEVTIRKALVQLAVEAAPEEVLHELCMTPFENASLVWVRVAAGMRDHLARFPMEAAARVVTESGLAGMLDEGNSELVLCVYLAVTAARLATGKTVTLDTGLHRSLTDHPLSASAAKIAAAFEAEFGAELPDPEVAGITEYLLGLVSLGVDPGKGGHDELVVPLTELAADRLDAALATDLELKRSLSQHLDRLAVRLRYGLPVFNPLLGEVAERYAEVHRVALELGEVIAEYFEAQLEEDEVGYITMYLSGAMERARLFPGRRVLVVCPSGMATAWVLVSRIQAEFPQFDVVNVLSLRGYQSLEDRDADLVISTVELAENGVPVVVVNPLLTSSDVRRLAAHV